MTGSRGPSLATGAPFIVLAEGLEHPEGIARGLDGRLYAGGEGGQIYAIDPDGSVHELADSGGSILGVAIDGRGRVYACDASRSEIVRVSPGDRTLEVYSTGPRPGGFALPNAMAFAPDGVLYVTDSGSPGQADGQIVAIMPDDHRAVVVAAGLTGYPNGCCLDADGTTLYVVLSEKPGVVTLGVSAGQRRGRLEHLAEVPVVPDGCALDVRGTLYVACYRPDRLYRIDPDGRIDVFADDPQGRTLNVPTNLAFWGPALDSIAVANVGEDFISVTAAPEPGLPLFYPTPV